MASKEKEAQRYRENRERILARNKAWNAANKDKVLAAGRRFGVSDKGRAKVLRRRAVGYISAETLRIVRETCDGLCSYCLGPGKEIEHILPISRGGTNDLENLTLACRQCNYTKGAKTPLEMLL